MRRVCEPFYVCICHVTTKNDSTHFSPFQLTELIETMVFEMKNKFTLTMKNDPFHTIFIAQAENLVFSRIIRSI